MIMLTGIKGDRKCLDASRIMEIKSVPDTVLVFLNGNCLFVRESVEEIVERLAMNPRRLRFSFSGGH